MVRGQVIDLSPWLFSRQHYFNNGVTIVSSSA
jgi:hypothetical protein